MVENDKKHSPIVSWLLDKGFVHIADVICDDVSVYSYSSHIEWEGDLLLEVVLSKGALAVIYGHYMGFATGDEGWQKIMFEGNINDYSEFLRVISATDVKYLVSHWEKGLKKK